MNFIYFLLNYLNCQNRFMRGILDCALQDDRMAHLANPPLASNGIPKGHQFIF